MLVGTLDHMLLLMRGIVESKSSKAAPFTFFTLLHLANHVQRQPRRNPRDA